MIKHRVSLLTCSCSLEGKVRGIMGPDKTGCGPDINKYRRCSRHLPQPQLFPWAAFVGSGSPQSQLTVDVVKSHDVFFLSPYSTEKRVCVGCPKQMKLT